MFYRVYRFLSLREGLSPMSYLVSPAQSRNYKSNKNLVHSGCLPYSKTWATYSGIMGPTIINLLGLLFWITKFILIPSLSYFSPEIIYLCKCRYIIEYSSIHQFLLESLLLEIWFVKMSVEYKLQIKLFFFIYCKTYWFTFTRIDLLCRYNPWSDTAKFRETFNKGQILQDTLYIRS